MVNYVKSIIIMLRSTKKKDVLARKRSVENEERIILIAVNVIEATLEDFLARAIAFRVKQKI